MNLMDRINANAHDDGGCLIWDGAMGSAGKTPVISMDGKVQNIRRALAIEAGINVLGMNASNTCNERRCVCPNHIKMMTRSELQNRSADELRGSIHNTLRGRKIAEARRPTTKHTMELAVAIRQAEGSQRAIAKQFGVSHYVVWSIRTGKSWKDYSNPYAQLMGARP